MDATLQENLEIVVERRTAALGDRLVPSALEDAVVLLVPREEGQVPLLGKVAHVLVGVPLLEAGAALNGNDVHPHRSTEFS